MQSRRATALVIALVLLGAALWLAGLFDGPPERGGPLEAGRLPDGPAAPGALRETGATQPELRGSSAPSTESEAPDATARPPFTLRVHGSDRTAVARARVRFFADDDGAASERLLREGTLALPAVVASFAGDFWIEVESALGESGDPLPLKSGWSGPHEPGEERIDVILRADRVLAGRVHDARGRPLAGARVVILRPRHGMLGKVAETASDEDGAFRVSGLGRGTCYVTAYPRGPHAEPDALEVEVGRTDVTLRMLPGVLVTVEVVTGAEAPLAGARVEAVTKIPAEGQRRRLRSVAQGRTDDEGRITLDGLDPERMYVLRVLAPRGRPDLSPVTDTAWRPADERVVLVRGRTLRGRVAREDGSPVADVTVNVMPEDGAGPARSARSSADGRFVLHGVPHGPLLLRAVGGPLGRTRRFAGARRVAADEDDVQVVVRPWKEAQFVVRVRDWPRGAPNVAVRLAGEPDPTTSTSVGSTVNDAGEAYFHTLYPAESYTLYLVTKDQALCAYARGVVATGRVVEVDLLPALEIRGRIRVPAAAGSVRIRAVGPGVRAAATIAPDGTYRIRGLPAGTWTLHATARLGGEVLTKSLQVVAGTSTDVVLAPSDVRTR